ncbi:hypothetical protein GCM10022291_26210 [Postechiella marina]|uniref:HTH luxR-type domain-containing protein n=1 Tax=Postechiella marina TaxID=943941 RepID=A0ABP8CD98_9FLAO
MSFNLIKSIFQVGCFLLTNVLLAQQSSSEVNSAIKTDSIQIKLNTDLEYFTKKKDTLEIVNTRIKRIKYYSKKGLYSKSYDEVWQSLHLLESPKFLTQRIEILDRLISLYIIFEQKDKAYKNLEKSINLVKNNSLNEKDKSKLLARLYNLEAWIEIRLTSNYDKAEALALKSIEAYKKTTAIIPDYSQIQLAHIYIKNEKLKEAKNILFKLQKDYPLPLKPIHALLHERIGQYYDAKKERDSAIYYFKTSLAAIDKFENHPDKKLQVAKKLSENYLAIKNYKLAYKYLLLTSNINDKIFSFSKSQNKELFEIKNKYESQLQENKEAIKSQQIKILENEKVFWRLRVILIVLFLFSAFGFVFFYFNRRSRIKILNQDFINQRQKDEIAKQDEILELKNKELLTSALQLLERDTLQEDIKKQLNTLHVKGDNIAIIKGIKNALKTSTTGKWKEFQAHFTKVNDSFFSSLKVQYPLLTPTDLKMCAFIKLGFSSKDMAQIMGITVEGINTSRSRLRKKMSLDRKVVLSEFLQSFS